MMDDEARAREFEREMVRAIDQLHREIAYNATRWRQMIGEHGGVGAARRLLEGTDASDGFTRLWETQRLDMSVEWFVLVYVDLFTDDERETAYQRLRQYHAPVDAWLRERLGRRWP